MERRGRIELSYGGGFGGHYVTDDAQIPESNTFTFEMDRIYLPPGSRVAIMDGHHFYVDVVYTNSTGSRIEKLPCQVEAIDS